MRISVLDDAISVCREHLVATGTRNTQVEAFLTRYLVVMICGEFEEQFERLVRLLASHVGDKYVSSFIEGSAGRDLQVPKIAKLKGFLGRFGPEWKEAFTNELDANPEGRDAYMTLVTNRNEIAHGRPDVVPLTFDDVERVYPKSLIVLAAFAKALGVPEST